MKLKLFLVILICYSCSDNKQEDITLLNGLIFEAKSGENVPVIDQNISKEYSKYLKESSSQIPLFKYIHHEKYGIFIGLPFGISMDSLMNITPSLPLMTRESEELDTSAMAYRRYSNRQGLQLHTLAYTINNSKLFIIARTYDKEIPDSILSQKSLINRIQKVKNP
jgi:hypothetical protein